MWLHEFNGFDSYPIFSHKWKNLDGREIPWDTSMIFRIDCGRDLSNTAWIIYFIMRKMMLYHDLSWFIMIYHDLWWFMMVYDDLWWFMMIYAHKSGSGINQYSLLVSPLIPSQHLVILGSRCAAGPDHSAIAQGFLKAPFSGVGVQQQHRSSPKAVHTQKYHQKRESLKCCQPKWNYQNYQNNKHITNENLPLIWSTFSNALCSDPVLLNGK